MAIINANKANKKEKIKVEISNETLKNIHAYCDWASIDNIGFFIEEAANFVFSKDSDWKKHIKSTDKKSEVI